MFRPFSFACLLLAATGCATILPQAGFAQPAKEAHAQLKGDAYVFDHGFVRATPGKISAAYVTITNPTDDADVLTGAAADWAGRIEMHDVTTNDEGVMDMKPVHEIPLPPHSRVVLTPGGKHLMLFNLAKQLKEGDQETITLNFRNAGAIQVPLKVQPLNYNPKAKAEQPGDAGKEAQGKAGATKADPHAHH